MHFFLSPRKVYTDTSTLTLTSLSIRILSSTFFLLHFPSAFCHPHFVIRILSSAFCHPHCFIHIFPFAFCHPHFSIRILSSAFFHPHFSIRIFPSAFCHPHFAIRHPPFGPPLTETHWQPRVDQRLMNGVYKTPFFIVKGHETCSVPRDVGLCFCLVFVSFLYFDCVTYLYVTINSLLQIKNVAPPRKKENSYHITPLPSLAIKATSLRPLSTLPKVAFDWICNFVLQVLRFP